MSRPGFSNRGQCGASHPAASPGCSPTRTRAQACWHLLVPACARLGGRSLNGAPSSSRHSPSDARTQNCRRRNGLTKRTNLPLPAVLRLGRWFYRRRSYHGRFQDGKIGERETTRTSKIGRRVGIAQEGEESRSDSSSGWRTSRKVSTTLGSNCVPAFRLSSPSAYR